jgi:pre-mRNA-splicing factor ATP-dependent RNA helicase DHX16
MPEDYIDESGKLSSKRKSDALYKRYEDNKAQRDREQFITDLDRYEEDQTKNSMLQAGALDRQNLALPADEYEYVFDEAAKIEWVLESKDALAGTMTKEEMELQMKIDAAEKKGESEFCGGVLFRSRY